MSTPTMASDVIDRASDIEREHSKKEWAAERHLRQSHAQTEPVRWLLGKTRHRFDCDRPRWFDHGTRWTRDGKPYCLVAQPYHLGGEEMQALLDLERIGLHVWVSCFPAWHYPGVCLSVIVKRRA